MKCIISAKVLLVIGKCFFDSSCFRFNGPSKAQSFYFSFFHFDDFLTFFTKNIMKKPPTFITVIKSSYINYYSLTKIWDLEFFFQWNDGLLKIFWILLGKAFSSLFIFIKFKNCCNLPFNDTYKMYYCNLLYLKLKLYKMAVFQLRAVKDMLLGSYFC